MLKTLKKTKKEGINIKLIFPFNSILLSFVRLTLLSDKKGLRQKLCSYLRTRIIKKNEQPQLSSTRTPPGQHIIKHVRK